MNFHLWISQFIFLSKEILHNVLYRLPKKRKLMWAFNFLNVNPEW